MYKIIDNQELIGTVESVLQNEGVQFKTTPLVNRRGTRFLTKFRLHSLRIDEDESSIIPEVVIVNGNTPGKALKIMVGMFRLVCTNGLIIGDSIFAEKIIHVECLRTNEKLAALELNIRTALEYIKSRLQQDIMKMKSITIDAQKREVIMKDLNLSKSMMFTINNIVDRGYHRIEDDPNTLWGLYNIINEQTRFKSRSSVAHFERDRKLVNKMMKLVA